ncbi:nondiscriminating glutamyl-tRNA synthetase [Caminicella sporogenes DSM 14501]|uniref:Glutamate--tRNA ligase n=1 Tax=Caminicella sporogenes DSM 14501 TaxID=1121266 RepID=A0A1M6SR51_9FIRM|nr:glutamate--tRNA ligase [Caminicella sporogenes]SHK47120.1 nondiscriminating glutamyl-tRNA synthetase [Caminicella sporogenes DSM 14501]
MTVRVRFAPSPTGYVHIGSLRTALYNYLFAKNQGGKYILRIEDTDRTRYVEGAIENMLKAMEWAGVVHDEGPFIENDEIVQRGDRGPYIQSERLDIYHKYIENLLESGHAYYCFCSKDRLDKIREQQRAQGLTPRYDGHCRNIPLEEARRRVEAGEPHVIRLKLPEDTDVTFTDLVRGEVTMNTRDLDDQVLIKTDGFPTYHFAVVIDDHFMGITHIIRGEEWLSSTPKHIILYDAFGWEKPKYVHLPNILNAEKKKLSKRHGDVAVEDFRKKGYLPEALVNYIALVGWSPDDNEEIMDMDEMIEKFSFDRVSKSGGVFDVDKLNWVNSHYIKKADLDRLTNLCIPYLVEAGLIKEDEKDEKYDWVKRIVNTAKERIEYLAQISDYAKRFFGEEVKLESEDVKEVLNEEHVSKLLNIFKEKVSEAEEINNEFGKKVFKTIQKETGIKGKKLYMPIRAALTGQLHGPDIDEVIVILGRENIIKRVEFVKNHYIIS